MPCYEAILFDFDGVLVDSEPVHFDCWNEVLRPYGIEMPWSVYAEHGIGISDRQMLTFLARQCTPPPDVEQLFTEYPRKKAMFRDRMLSVYHIEPDILSYIETLHGPYKTAVVTSSGRTEVEPILETSKLLAHLDTCVYGGDVQRLKPAPDPYLLAASRLNITRALVVEDSAAGQAAGWAAGFDVLRIAAQSELLPRLRERLAQQHDNPQKGSSEKAKA